MKIKTLSFISDILIGGVVGIVIDYLAGTSFIFTILGLVAGLVLALIINKKKG